MRRMRALVATSLSLLLAAGVGAQGKWPKPTGLVGRTFEAHVVRILDGDTFDVIQSQTKRPIRVRLDGVDAPEKGEPFSQRAATFTRVAVFDRIVTVIGKDVDRNTRLVARVISDGKDLSKEVVSAGLACHFLRFSSDPVLALAEGHARSEGLGFWAVGAGQPRCVALNQPALSVSAVEKLGFFGNTSSRVYHTPTCKNAHCKNCTEHFNTASAAERAGYRPAGDCLKKGGK